jgi:hypothetical protein
MNNELDYLTQDETKGLFVLACYPRGIWLYTQETRYG